MEICNYLVEKTIRPTKLGAKNWLFIGNEMSGQKCASFTPSSRTAAAWAINPKQHLTDVLTRQPGMKASEAASLTPANWLKARSGEPERMAA